MKIVKMSSISARAEFRERNVLGLTTLYKQINRPCMICDYNMSADNAVECGQGRAEMEQLMTVRKGDSMWK